MKRKRSAVVVLVAVLLSPMVANADDFTIGIKSASGNSIPFGTDSYLDYQQVYASSEFEGSTSIDQLTFFNTVSDSGNYSLVPVEFSLYLSTTLVEVGGMSADLAANVGADETLVYSGLPPGNSVSGFGGEFVFDLLVPFLYDPSAGNLLLRVALAGRTTHDLIFLDRDGSGVTGRSFGNEFGVNANSGGGLVTKFGVSEPRTVAEQLEDLASLVLAINLQAGIANSLDTKLTTALTALDDTNESNDGAALNSMYALCNNVEAQRGKKLTDAQANELISAVNEIISTLDEFAPLCE